MRQITGRWMTLVTAAGLAVVMWAATYLGAATQPGQPPFRNPVDQREQMIRELQEIKTAIREQNSLLRSLLEKK